MTLTLEASSRPVESGKLGRSRGLDALRGLAVLTMVADHAALFAGLEPVRHTVGRLAMPLFFLLSGHLFRRLSWRWAVIFATGVALPLLAPWVDSPNVLVWLALSAVTLRALHYLHVPPWLPLALVLTMLANPVTFGSPYLAGSYPPLTLLGLFLLGSLIPRTSLSTLDRLPHKLTHPLSLIGRYPLSTYVLHVLLLTAIF